MGIRGGRVRQLQANLRIGDLIVFYAGLADTHGSTRLVYALIGIFEIEQFSLAVNVATEDRDINAHTRRVLASDCKDLIVRARPKVSGRLKRCLPIGEFRDCVYRVRPDILNAWGGLSVTNGYLQRSARLPRLLNPQRFLHWLEMQRPMLIQSNN